MNFRILRSSLLSAFSLLAFAFVFSSCSKDDSMPENNTKRQKVTFKANPLLTETKSVSTRVSVTPGDINGDDALSWEDNELISINFGNSTDFKTDFKVTLEGDGSASLTGDRPGENGVYNIYAISPASISYFQGSVLGDAILSIPRTQDQDGQSYSHLNKYVYMHASSNTPVTLDDNGYSGDVTLDFELLTSLLRFDIVNNSCLDVKLDSIKISFPNNEGTLYNEVKLDEESGAISTTDVATHSDMSLTFSNADLAEGNSFVGYMCLFPTSDPGQLNVNLFITYDGDKTQTIEYKIPNAPAFLAGNRYVVPLDIDFPLYMIIRGKPYLCYDYNGTIWMIENLAYQTGNAITCYDGNPEKQNGYYYTWDEAVGGACPEDEGWAIPTLAQWSALRDIVNWDLMGSGKWWTQADYGGFAGVYYGGYNEWIGWDEGTPNEHVSLWWASDAPEKSFAGIGKLLPGELPIKGPNFCSVRCVKKP